VTPRTSSDRRGLPVALRTQHVALSRARRLEELIDGRLRPMDPSAPLVWSAQTEWSGFLLERNVCRDGFAGSVLFPYAEILLVLTGAIRVKYRERGFDREFSAGPDSVTLWPAGHELSCVSWTVEPGTQTLRVQMDMLSLERLMAEDDPLLGLRLTPRFAIAEPTLASIVRLMEADVVAGCPAGKIYGESLALALAAYLAAHYASESIDASPRNGLAEPVLTRVLEHIGANLGRDLTITELAALAHMSPHHFSLRFKRSMGTTPHQWIVRARVREAGRLLRARRMPVAEVALALGFASQTHFTDVFRRATGVTPRHYQRLR
jgi:AraC family transcriptional regulator